MPRLGGLDDRTGVRMKRSEAEIALRGRNVGDEKGRIAGAARFYDMRHDDAGLGFDSRQNVALPSILASNLVSRNTIC